MQTLPKATESRTGSGPTPTPQTPPSPPPCTALQERPVLAHGFYRSDHKSQILKKNVNDVSIYYLTESLPVSI